MTSRELFYLQLRRNHRVPGQNPARNAATEVRNGKSFVRFTEAMARSLRAQEQGGRR